MKKTSVFGLSENVAGMLAYVLGFISGIVVLVLEKDNKVVRFHALQSTIWFAFLAILGAVVGTVIGWIPIIGSLVTTAIGIVVFASWIFLMVMTVVGNKFSIPLIGDVVDAQINGKK